MIGWPTTSREWAKLLAALHPDRVTWSGVTADPAMFFVALKERAQWALAVRRCAWRECRRTIPLHCTKYCCMHHAQLERAEHARIEKRLKPKPRIFREAA